MVPGNVPFTASIIRFTPSAVITWSVGTCGKNKVYNVTSLFFAVKCRTENSTIGPIFKIWCVVQWKIFSMWWILLNSRLLNLFLNWFIFTEFQNKFREIFEILHQKVLFPAKCSTFSPVKFIFSFCFAWNLVFEKKKNPPQTISLPLGRLVIVTNAFFS